MLYIKQLYTTYHIYGGIHRLQYMYVYIHIMYCTCVFMKIFMYIRIMAVGGCGEG